MFDIFNKPFASWTLIDLLWLSPFVALVWLFRGLYLHWWLGRQGLNQWPDPYGRFYDEWMQIETSDDDLGENYYDWLAKKKLYREPWVTWAKMDAEIHRQVDAKYPSAEPD